MNKSYNEIREICELVSYDYKLACNAGLWVETYMDYDHNRIYHALFTPSGTSHLPITITYLDVNDEL